MEIMVGELGEVLTIGEIALKTLSRVSKSKYYFNYFKPALRIAVLGESGGGKSSFLSMLLGKEYENDSTRYNKTIHITLPNGRRIVFTDCPGQKSYRQERQKIKEKILAGKYHAIINVVCYGYNETSSSKIKMFDSGTSNVKESYLSENRKRELNQLTEWIDDINIRSKLKWVLTVINKADVWAENHDDVIEYYQNGEYGKVMNQINPVCQHHILPYCSIISPFGGEPMVLRISEKNKRALHESLLANLQDFIGNV